MLTHSSFLNCQEDPKVRLAKGKYDCEETLEIFKSFAFDGIKADGLDEETAFEKSIFAYLNLNGARQVNLQEYLADHKRYWLNKSVQEVTFHRTTVEKKMG